MKLNIILLAVFVLLGVFAYFHEEVGKTEEEQQRIKKSQLLDTSTFGSLKSIQLTDDTIVIDGEQMKSGNSQLEVSIPKVRQTFKVLSNIHSKRILTDEEMKKINVESFVKVDSPKLSFQFEQGNLTFWLGQKIDYGQDFYMKIRRNEKDFMVVATDTAVHSGVSTQEEEYNSANKYNRLLNVFLRPGRFYYETRILRDVKTDHWEKVVFVNDRNRSFQLYLSRMLTSPMSPVGVPVDPAKVKLYSQHLLAARGLSVFKKDKVNFDPKAVGEIEIHHKEGSPIKLSLYKSHDQAVSHYAKSSDKDSYFAVDGSVGRLFFQNAQHFWNKRPLLSTNDQELKLIDQKGEQSSVVTGKSKKLELLRFLTTDSDMVSSWPKGLRSIKSNMNIRVGDQDFFLVHADKQLVVYDNKRKVRFSYFCGDEPPIKMNKNYYLKE